MTPIVLGAVVRGAGHIVDVETIGTGQLRLTFANGSVIWCYPDEDYISDDGWLILESASVDDHHADEPVRPPWAERERKVA
jgi:hypothetical protein